MIEQAAAPKKEVARAPLMRQLSRMRKLLLSCLSTIALASCGLPAPYQTYAPDQPSAPLIRPSPIIVYGSTTTMPDMVPDASEVEPVPAPAPATSAPASNRVAICYNRIWNRLDTIKDAAVQACGGAPSPQITSQGLDIDACPLLTPTKAIFACGASTR